ncbi:hypothetical protein PUNSTDRAFT_31527, partial [Punctularia strigosozonata HHB-11173 SS5]|uniref:uncharacterized protein n=1 Tax=Punctularia strigosozonata (strain HHB-11173) TaxID=741275 RepID=UPI0004417C26
KKANQWRTWQTVTIPELIMPYMDLLSSTSHLTTPYPASPTCSCNMHNKDLEVLAVYQDRLERITIRVCSCTSSARQLLARGLFPCAPLEPSVAFDLNMLEMVATLFLYIAPNVTAWTATLETLLGARGHKLETRHSLRRRFGNALNWYSYMRDRVQARVAEEVEKARRAV